MKIKLVAGGEFDIASGGEVRSAIDDMGDKLAKRLLRQDRRPVYVKRSAGVQGTNGQQTFVFDFGSPPANCMWYLVHLSYTFYDGTTYTVSAISSNLSVYVGGQLPDVGTLIVNPGNFVHLFGGLEREWTPNTPIPVQFDERCYVVGRDTLTAVQAFTFNALFLEVADPTTVAGPRDPRITS